MVDGKVQAPKERRSIGDFAAQKIKDAKGSFKRRMRRPKSTTTIATSPPPVETSPPPVEESSPPVEESSPEALRSDKPEENPPEPLPQVPLLDPQDKDEPIEDGEDKEEPVEDGEDGVLFRGRPPGAPQRSNVAAFFWSRLELVSISISISGQSKAPFQDSLGHRCKGYFLTYYATDVNVEYWDG